MPPRLTTALAAACALISLWATSASGLTREVKIPISNVETVFGPSVTPKKLARVGATPIALDISGRIKTLDGSRPPAVKEFVLDLDRHIAIDARGLPVCKGGQRDLRPVDLKSRCKHALVGKGRVGVQIQFPELPPISTESELIVVNAGSRKAGRTILYAVAYLTQPITTSFAMTIEITKHPRGSRVVIEVPKLADGAGSLTYLKAKLKKRFTRNGEPVDFLTGSCTKGKLQSETTALFVDGTIIQGTALQTCVPRKSSLPR